MLISGEIRIFLSKRLKVVCFWGFALLFMQGNTSTAFDLAHIFDPNSVRNVFFHGTQAQILLNPTGMPVGSWRHAVREIVVSHGFHLSDQELEKISSYGALQSADAFLGANLATTVETAIDALLSMIPNTTETPFLFTLNELYEQVIGNHLQIFLKEKKFRAALVQLADKEKVGLIGLVKLYRLSQKGLKAIPQEAIKGLFSFLGSTNRSYYDVELVRFALSLNLFVETRDAMVYKLVNVKPDLADEASSLLAELLLKGHLSTLKQVDLEPLTRHLEATFRGRVKSITEAIDNAKETGKKEILLPVPSLYLYQLRTLGLCIDPHERREIYQRIRRAALGEYGQIVDPNLIGIIDGIFAHGPMIAGMTCSEIFWIN